jgi:methionyl-tRNA synthetase
MGRPQILFKRMEDETVARLDETFKARIRAAEGKAAEEKPVESKLVSFEQFKSVEMRAGSIVSSERIKGSDKLLKLQVDIGTEVRQIVAGIALAYDPDELKGRRVVVVTNLQPAKLFGVESNGMLLAADHEGRAYLLKPDGEVPPGTVIR